MNVLSLFSGIGGIDLGLERAGMKVVAHSEIDPYASRVLAKHWPGVPNLGDLTRWRYTDGGQFGPCINVPDPDADLDSDSYMITGWPMWGERHIDVIAGGFPCQDISYAGKGAGLEGKRSGLWFEYLRCIEAIKPRYVIIENVPALRRRGLDTVLRGLHACGYDAEWAGVSARNVGARHLRDRIWIVAWLADTNNERRERSGTLAGEAGRDGSANSGRDGTVAHTDSDAVRLEQGRSSGTRGEGAPFDFFPRETGGADEVLGHPNISGLERLRGLFQRPRKRSAWSDGETLESGRVAPPHIRRVVARLPSRVDRLKCLGNAVVPQVAEHVGRCVIEFDRTRT